ncbi:hypothetical protein OsJ_04344 [Oryza sativa Japonica Group]|uniref:Uncharacterized protein n=1 Tax=Oryza sativa subsp. japonica TaxID=39947 RepID=B9EV00_ORYSJ|nr:hypothetical protein OsJ_04344 [Oryza sativa Japonica Group]
MARIIRRHGGGRILRRSREEKRRLSEGGGGASQQPQGPAEDDYCPVIGSKINMDGISDQEVANAYSFVFSFDEALRSIKLEEGRLLIHIADLYEMKRSLDDKITSLKAAVKSSPSADILRRIKSTRTKNNETQEEIYADKSLLAKTRLKLESPRSWRISIDEVAVVADSDGDADVNAEQLLHLLEHVGAIGENTYGSNASATTTGRSVHSVIASSGTGGVPPSYSPSSAPPDRCGCGRSRSSFPSANSSYDGNMGWIWNPRWTPPTPTVPEVQVRPHRQPPSARGREGAASPGKHLEGHAHVGHAGGGAGWDEAPD